MADAYYYQDFNAQIVGPLVPAALKKLANEGVIAEATLVRKGEQGAWYGAGTIAGLVPPRPAEPQPFNTSDADPKQRARETFRKAEEQADKVAAKLWFLDLKFTHFFTPKLAGALWAVLLCLVALLFFIGVIQALVMLPTHPFYAMASLLVEFVGLILAVLYARVMLEALLVVFRIAEHLENLKYLENLKHLDAQGKPPAGL